jgi:hypothetical protein
MVPRVSHGRIKVLAAVVLLFAAAFYLWRDLNLSDEAGGLRRLPDIEVENLDFRRTIESRDWRLQARSAERDSGLTRASDMTITVKDLDSENSTLLRAATGEFSEEGVFEIRSLDGVLFFDDRSMEVTAPAAIYERSTDIWSFNEGIDLRDEKTFITGGTASISNEGVLSLRKGAIVRWRAE